MRANYAFFVRDAYVTVRSPHGSSKLTRIDLTRSLADAERPDVYVNAARTYERGVKLLKSGEIDGALAIAKNLDARSKQDGFAAIGVVQALLLRKGEHASAVATYDRIIAAFAGARETRLVRKVATARLNRARALMSAGRLGEAVAESVNECETGA